MRKFLVLWLGMFLLSAAAATAQIASGNVADSSNPRSDVNDSQNFLASRTIEGCVVQQASDYLLLAKHGRPEVLTSNPSVNLRDGVGHQVKVSGRETYAPAGVNPDADYAVAVDQIAVTAPSCPAHWNEKWVRRFAGRP